MATRKGPSTGAVGIFAFSKKYFVVFYDDDGDTNQRLFFHFNYFPWLSAKTKSHIVGFEGGPIRGCVTVCGFQKDVKFISIENLPASE
jgi:hypothetical protein